MSIRKHEAAAGQVSLEELMTLNAVATQPCDCVHLKRDRFSLKRDHLPGAESVGLNLDHRPCKHIASWLVTQKNHAGQAVPLYLCTNCAKELKAQGFPGGVEPLT